MIQQTCMSRQPWQLPFLAEAEEVAGIRNVLRVHLRLWGLSAQTEAAQVCASELVGNVIHHVGAGTPTTLAVSMNGTYLRIEVHDPDIRALPTLMEAAPDAERGRGMALVNAVADRWGVLLRADRKVTWCEIATALSSPHGHGGGVRVTRAEEMITMYGAAKAPRTASRTLLNLAAAEEAAIDVIADLLHWLQAHGCDPDEALDRAQRHFEAEMLA
ncbi:ATP-binding protein [Streptomyces sp. TRM49041]|uniref:ATP-binding protein n=1 Tax=Streptomyces sp. TRM49041 TaxID=2603216 RepID=UPI0011EDDA03|nr:ATP-binding protein [Streptomyces sp. TRM49041]